MPTFKYTKTKFKEPGIISEELYWNLKSRLNDSSFNIDPNPETFSEHFKSILLTIGICALLFFLGIIFTAGMHGNDSSIWNPIMGISICLIFVMIFNLLAEGPSFATYLKQKEEYFSRLKYAIQNTASYKEFVSIFY